MNTAEKILELAKKLKCTDAVLAVDAVLRQNERFVDEHFYGSLSSKEMYFFNDKSAIIIDDDDIEVTNDKNIIYSIKKEIKTERMRDEKQNNKRYNLNREYSDSEFDLYF